MFFRRDKPSSDPPAERAATPAAAGVSADDALDLAADLLRTYGENAFDLDEAGALETRGAFDQWARHILVGAPIPGEGAPEGGGPPAKRETGRARRAFRDHRRAERDFVTTTLGHYRQATWAFLGGLRRSLASDRISDDQVSARMQGLEAAVRDGDAARIKAEAQDAVTVIARVLTEREERSATQVAELASRLDALRAELEAARSEAATDALTGLFNRGAFDEQLEREVDLSLLFRTDRALLMLDIDHFKRVNDERGHRFGDEVLRRVADVLARCFMRKDDYIARYGGEEFAIVLREVNEHTARQLAERALHALRELEIAVDDWPPIGVTASIGVAQLRDGESPPEWVERADRALYRAKNGGRDRVEVASESAALAGEAAQPSAASPTPR